MSSSLLGKPLSFVLLEFSILLVRYLQEIATQPLLIDEEFKNPVRVD
ncbi:hypothetical protein HanIR_Chr05g0244701 [Helianthus annuus]|nr:hypothetical protein HanIR_Chr05g0244701 [Helianthus annuus]